MTKHDRRRKVHQPVAIRGTGKGDQAAVECSCGFTEVIATWFIRDETEIYRGAGKASIFVSNDGIRTKEEFQRLVKAVDAFCQAQYLEWR